METISNLKDFLKEWGIEKYKIDDTSTIGEITITLFQEVKYYKEFLENLKNSKPIVLSFRIITNENKLTKFEFINNRNKKLQYDQV